ncbi:MAG: response regulator [Devosiaceae bacterium]|nr:response regulator [Devosiaceae bacterium]
MIVPADLCALVVDDNEYARALGEDALKKLGLKSILCAKDATVGLQLAQNNQLDFVLLDWYMPDINGAGFIRLVRGGQAGCSPDLPIIVATAYATRENIKRIHNLGIKEILVKPFDTRQLGLAISSALSTPLISPSNKAEDETGGEQIIL